MNKAVWISQMQIFYTIEQVKNTKCQSVQCLFYYLDDCLEKNLEQLRIVSEAFTTNLSWNIGKFLKLFRDHESGNCKDNGQDNGIFEDLFNLKINRTEHCISSIQSLEYFHFKIKKSSLFEPNKNIKSFLKGFFCENCRNFHQDSLKVEKVPEHTFIALESENNPLTIEILRIFQNIPLALPSDYLTGLENSANLKLSAMILSNLDSSFIVFLNKNRLWNIPYLNKQDCSLFDLICDSTMGGFYPIQLLYSRISRGPLKISSKAWQEANSKVLCNKKLKTFTCGKIREENCFCCSSNPKSGWTCPCGTTNQYSICKCGKFISRCPKCNNFTTNDTCQVCNHEFFSQSSSNPCSIYTSCSVCSSQWDSLYNICKTCLNPDPLIFLFRD